MSSISGWAISIAVSKSPRLNASKVRDRLSMISWSRLATASAVSRDGRDIRSCDGQASALSVAAVLKPFQTAQIRRYDGGGGIGTRRLSSKALPRDPGGFEGLVLGSEAKDRSNNFSLAECVKIELVDIDRDATRLALPLPMRRADHGARTVDVFLDVNAELVKGRDPQLQDLSDRWGALNHHRLIGGVPQVLEHGVWRVERREGSEIS